MKKCIYFTICIHLFILSDLTAQSPWTKHAGRIYAQLSLNAITGYDELYGAGSTPIATERKIQDITIQGWVEWGISRSSTVLLALPLKMLNAGDINSPALPDPMTAEGSMTAPGNIRLGFKQGLTTAMVVTAAQIWLEMPTGDYDEQTGLRSGYDALAVIPSFNLGSSGSEWYAYGNIAYGYRGNNYSHFLQVGAEAGYHFMPLLSVAVYLEWLNSLNNGSRQDPVNNLLTGLYVNNQEYMAWGIKIFSNIFSDNSGVALGIAGAFSGNYVPRAPALNLAIYHQF
jgi:hypothetical protein